VDLNIIIVDDITFEAWLFTHTSFMEKQEDMGFACNTGNKDFRRGYHEALMQFYIENYLTKEEI